MSWLNNNTNGVNLINWDLDELRFWSNDWSSWLLSENLVMWLESNTIILWFLAQVQKTLNRIMELLVKSSLFWGSLSLDI